MPLQKLLFTAGLNTDFSSELVRQGEARLRMNVRVLSSQNGEEESCETMNGNSPVSYTLPSGNNTVIGAKEYLIGSKIYYFIYNSTNKHSILEYDEVALSVQPVYIDTTFNILNFSLTHLITGINVIKLNDAAHLLYWTDAFNEPRKINIEKGIYRMNGNFTLGYPTVFNPEFIYRIKQPMPQAPVTIYGDDTSKVVNRLDKQLFQFKIQNVFDDYETSSWSPISKTRYPLSTLVNSVNNKITITFDTGTEIVKKIRIAVKFVNDPNFKLVVELDKAQLGLNSNTTSTFVFYNDGNYLPLEVNESIKLFDNVPKLSQSQEIIYGNRITDGLVTEGFDPVNVDLKLEQTINFIIQNPTPTSIPVNALKRGGDYVFGVIYADHANREGTTQINLGKSDVIQPNGSYGTELLVPFYTSSVGAPAQISITYNTLAGGNFAISDYVQALSNTGKGYVVGITILSPTTGTLIIGGLTGTWTAGVSVAQVTGPVSADYTTVVSVANPVWGGSYPIVNWSLFNEPPAWATHYWFARVVNAANDRYLQYEINYIQYRDNTGAVVVYGSSTQMAVNIAQVITDGQIINPGSLLVYDFIVGDRIRFITDEYGNFFPTYIDFQIASFDATTGNLTIKYPIGYTPRNFTIATPTGGGQLIEIYQPALPIALNESITYEIADGNMVTYDSARGHYVHTGDGNVKQIITAFTSATYGSPPTFNVVLPTGHGLVGTNKVKITGPGYSVYGTVSSSSANAAVIATTTTLVGTFGAGAGAISYGATGFFDGGDTFYRARQMSYNNSASTLKTAEIEDANYSDQFISKGYDYGRPNRIDPNFKEITRPSTVYWSEQFIQDTFINGLSTVYDTSFQEYEAKYGGIYKLYAENQRLIAFQELKIGGILVQQIVYNNATGGSVVGISTDVLSPQMVYDVGEFGIGKNPESFAVYANSIYGIDVKRGVIWRKAQNGVTPISDEGNISTFIRQQCNLILQTSTKVPIYGVFDIRFGEYIVAFDSFIYGASLISGTLTVGDTYKIITYHAGDDFTNVGGSNVTGDIFVAMGTTPAVWGNISGHSVLSLYTPAVSRAWNESRNAWSSGYDYAPEMMVSKGIDIVTFKNGALWTHNTNPIQGNFYGVQYYAEVWLVANMLPSNKKVLKAISLESNAGWNVTIDSPEGQTTSLIPNNFQAKEGFMYSEVLRDDNTPNVLLPRFEGNPMRSCTFLVKLKYQNTNYNKLFAVNVLMIQSQRSNK